MACNAQILTIWLLTEENLLIPVVGNKKGESTVRER